MKFKDAIELFSLPRVRINLMFDKTSDNDPFYAEAVQRFYAEAVSLHPKFLFAARKYEYGYAMCRLPATFEDYFKTVDSSAHRNYRKALRLGYSFRRLDYNAHLDDIRDIWVSTPVRQGVLPQEMREGRVLPISDPPSRSTYHDYPYFGVFKDDKLVAYAACLVAGEICSLNDLYGHARFLADGIVPLAIIEVARELLTRYPSVKYYGYGTYFGASDSMRRFKVKFNFRPHRVTWVLPSASGVQTAPPLVYRLDATEPLQEQPAPIGRVMLAADVFDLLFILPSWWRTYGLKVSLIHTLKVLTGKRIFYGIEDQGLFVHSGWANLGFCRYYPVERDAVVLGTLWTDPDFRGHDLATAGSRHVMAYLQRRGVTQFYIDTQPTNGPCLRMIAKLGFQQKGTTQPVTADDYLPFGLGTSAN